MRFLIISILFITVISCGTLSTTANSLAISSTEQIENLYFSNTAVDYVYKAKININDNNFGGLLIVKKIAENHHRVVFTTEFGNKIFDFEFLNTTFKVNTILKKIDKKIVVNALKKDFHLLVNQLNTSVNKYDLEKHYIYQTEFNNKDNYYFFKKEKKVLNKIVMASKYKEKVSIHFNNTDHFLAKNILIVHHNFNMNIQLNYIN